MQDQTFRPKVLRVIELVDGFYIEELEIIYSYWFFRLFKKITRKWVKLKTKYDCGLPDYFQPILDLETAKIEMERLQKLPKYHYLGNDEEDWNLKENSK